MKIAVGVAEAGELVSVSAQLVREWCTSGVLPHLKNGNKFIIRIDTLKAFIEANQGKDLQNFNSLNIPGGGQ